MKARSALRMASLAFALALAAGPALGGGLPAFPGAQGFGAGASGGRGGQVYRVTNLDASGPGSLQWAADRPGARTVVFAVSGVIHSDVYIDHGNLTIAGQTAPGAGITIHGHLYSEYEFGISNIIVRHLRVRSPLSGPGWPDGARISVHHNLFAHARARTPALATGPADVRNNVIYNGREGFTHHNPAAGDFNIVGNYYRDGQSNTLAPLWFDPENGPTVPSRYYVWNNWVDDPGIFTGRVDNPFTTAGFGTAYTFECCGIQASQFNAVGELDFSAHAGYVPIPTTSPAAAYEEVLKRAGAWPRDTVNWRAENETRSRTGTNGNHRPADWLEGLVPDVPPPDADQDGMGDAWELLHGLNPANGADHATVRPSGYTAIEEYVNELADAITGRLFADGFEIGGFGRWALVVP